VLNTAYDGPLHVGLELEGLAYGLLRQTHDFREGSRRSARSAGPSSRANSRPQVRPCARSHAPTRGNMPRA
jgi:hypothetical protein